MPREQRLGRCHCGHSCPALRSQKAGRQPGRDPRRRTCLRQGWAQGLAHRELERAWGRGWGWAPAAAASQHTANTSHKGLRLYESAAHQEAVMFRKANMCAFSGEAAAGSGVCRVMCHALLQDRSMLQWCAWRVLICCCDSLV